MSKHWAWFLTLKLNFLMPFLKETMVFIVYFHNGCIWFYHFEFCKGSVVLLPYMNYSGPHHLCTGAPSVGLPSTLLRSQATHTRDTPQTTRNLDGSLHQTRSLFLLLGAWIFYVPNSCKSLHEKRLLSFKVSHRASHPGAQAATCAPQAGGTKMAAAGSQHLDGSVLREPTHLLEEHALISAPHPRVWLWRWNE